MSTAVSNASPPRLLKPVSGKIQNDGAAFVPLSPHKGMRNASVIYQAIRAMPDKTLVRGDFDKSSRPLIYFPERPPKRIGQRDAHSAVARNPWNDPERQPANIRRPNREAIDAHNAAHDRAELVNFLNSIIESAYFAAPPRSLLLQAAIDLKNKTREINAGGFEFTVGDLRKPLKVIARAYALRDLKGIASPYRKRPAHDPELQARRFRQFTSLDQSGIDRLCDAFDAAADEQDRRDAVLAMQGFLKKYRIQREAEDIAFPAYVRQHRIPRDVFSFAQCWIKLMQPENSTLRQKLCIEAWSLEMDRICPLIVKEYKTVRTARRRGGSSEEWSEIDRSSTVYSRQVSMPQLRRVSQEEPVADQKIDGDQSSESGKSSESSKTSKSQKSDGSEPKIVFLSPKVEVRKVLSYSEIYLATGPAAPARVPRHSEPELEEWSGRANVSGHADNVSQEEQ